VAEWKILFDPVGVGGINFHGGPQASAAFGAFVRQKVAFTGTRPHDLPAGGDFKSFGHRFSGFNSFGASHSSTNFKKSAKYMFREALKQGVFSCFRLFQALGIE
jgi:hypothetical protein